MILCANPNAQFQSYREELESAVLDVMRSNRYILGDQVKSLEYEFSSYIGTDYALGVANGTDAIELALMALDITRDDEVITVSHTAVATISAIESVGAIPILVDVDETYYTLNIDQLEEAISRKTKAIIVVHIYGQAANIEHIYQFCQKHNIYLIEDVSQAHGAKFKSRRLGSYGHIGCFSCYPTKNLGAIGDAGLVVSNDKDLMIKLGMLREYGWRHRYVSEISGRNSRLDEIQAAILRVKLRYLDNANDKRRKLAAIYTEGLKGLDLITPEIRENTEHVFHLYVIRVNRRNELLRYLENKGVQCGIHYPLPVHLQPAYYGRIRSSSNMSKTELLANEVLSLPIYPELEEDNVHRVIKLIHQWSCS